VGHPALQQHIQIQEAYGGGGEFYTFAIGGEFSGPCAIQPWIRAGWCCWTWRAALVVPRAIDLGTVAFEE
jgi:hypothetical protein